MLLSKSGNQVWTLELEKLFKQLVTFQSAPNILKVHLQSGAKSIGEMVAILDFALFNYRVITDKYTAN